MAKNMKPVEVGSVVAFNNLPDAAWFDVIAKDRDAIVVREHGTNYAPQDAYASMVKQVRS